MIHDALELIWEKIVSLLRKLPFWSCEEYDKLFKEYMESLELQIELRSEMIALHEINIEILNTNAELLEVIRRFQDMRDL